MATAFKTEDATATTVMNIMNDPQVKYNLAGAKVANENVQARFEEFSKLTNTVIGRVRSYIPYTEANKAKKEYEAADARYRDAVMTLGGVAQAQITMSSASGEKVVEQLGKTKGAELIAAALQAAYPENYATKKEDKRSETMVPKKKSPWEIGMVTKRTEEETNKIFKQQ